MKLKPSILREIAAKETPEDSRCSVIKHNYASADDVLFLEDDVQRIILDVPEEESINSCFDKLITGVPCAILGLEKEDASGHFLMEDILFVEPQPSLPITLKLSTGSEWIGFVSGLMFSSDQSQMTTKHQLGLRLLSEFLRHESTYSAKRIVIVGNSIQYEKHSDKQARFISRKAQALSVAAMKKFDDWLTSLPLGSGNHPIQGISVDIVPGEYDCASQLMPQQPIHPNTLPKSRKLAGPTDYLKSVTNPYYFSFHDRKLLVTSGQFIDNIRLYTKNEDPLTLMECLLQWGHLGPTCPDTLATYPFTDKDPLAIFESTDYPAIFVSGNGTGEQPIWRRASLKMGANDGQGALLLHIPSFHSSLSMVFVNVHTFECRKVCFDTDNL
ncbi:DNA polymerase delta subunit 2 [Cichlidogyrus casuarinus]|uniref:DNA polymerase delta subunit 2 n=1 Tax=Cichlidogyrus casuarinus TaxID=1844966 RepID=A0ABD2QE07_9PLAT